MDHKALHAAQELLNFIADVNGNVYSDFQGHLNFQQKIKLNRLVKKLFTTINNSQCQPNQNKL